MSSILFLWGCEEVPEEAQSLTPVQKKPIHKPLPVAHKNAAFRECFRRWAACSRLPLHKKEFIFCIGQHLFEKNQQVLNLRQTLAYLIRKSRRSPSEEQLLKKYCTLYRVRSPRALLLYVDAIPLSLGLAQCIEESGWGRSLSARKKNAYFGMGRNGRCMSFKSIAISAACYIDLLNSSPVYKTLRQRRELMRASKQRLDGLVLVDALQGYGAHTQRYRQQVKRIIRCFDLRVFDGAL